MIFLMFVLCQPPQSTLPVMPQSTLPKVGCAVNGIAWKKLSYREALDRGKPLMIYFTTSNCRPCSELQAFTFTDDAVIKSSRNFTAVYADEEMVRLFNVTRFPTIVLVNRGLAWQNVGMCSPDALTNFLKIR